MGLGDITVSTGLAWNGFVEVVNSHGNPVDLSGRDIQFTIYQNTVPQQTNVLVLDNGSAGGVSVEGTGNSTVLITLDADQTYLPGYCRYELTIDTSLVESGHFYSTASPEFTSYSSSLAIVQGKAGPAGSSGVVAATAPLAYDASTKTVSIPAGSPTVDGYYPHADAAKLAGLPAAVASLASPALTGTPTAPTAAAGMNTTQIATTAFVAAAIGVVNAAVATLASGAPSTLDTFLEAYNRFLADESAAAALTTLVGTKITSAQAAAQINAAVAAYLPLTGGAVSGTLTASALNVTNTVAVGGVNGITLYSDGEIVTHGDLTINNGNINGVSEVNGSNEQININNSVAVCGNAYAYSENYSDGFFSLDCVGGNFIVGDASGDRNGTTFAVYDSFGQIQLQANGGIYIYGQLAFQNGGSFSDTTGFSGGAVANYGGIIINGGSNFDGGSYGYGALDVGSLTGCAAQFGGQVGIAAGNAGFTDPSPGELYDVKCGGVAGGITSVGSINANGGYLVNNVQAISDAGNLILPTGAGVNDNGEGGILFVDNSSNSMTWQAGLNMQGYAISGLPLIQFDTGGSISDAGEGYIAVTDAFGDNPIIFEGNLNLNFNGTFNATGHFFASGYSFQDDGNGGVYLSAGSTQIQLNATGLDMGSGSVTGLFGVSFIGDGSIEGDGNGGTLITGPVKFAPQGAPSSATEGTLYWDSTAHALKVYNGSAWKTVSVS